MGAMTPSARITASCARLSLPALRGDADTLTDGPDAVDAPAEPADGPGGADAGGSVEPEGGSNGGGAGSAAPSATVALAAISGCFFCQASHMPRRSRSSRP